MDAILTDLVTSLDTAYRRSLRHTGTASDASSLTTSQLRYIDAVHAIGRPTVSEVAAALDVSRPAATTGVQRLVQRGYLVKTRSSQDGRSILVTVTAAGERLVRAKSAALQAYGEAVRAALSDEEVVQFGRLVAKLSRHFGGSAEAAPTTTSRERGEG